MLRIDFWKPVLVFILIHFINSGMISHELASGMAVLWILRHVGGTVCLDYWSDILRKLLEISRNWLIHLSVSTSLVIFAKILNFFFFFFFLYCVNLTPRGRFSVMLKKLKLQGPAVAPASSRRWLGPDRGSVSLNHHRKQMEKERERQKYLC